MLEVTGLALSRGLASLGPLTFALPQPGCWWLTGASGAGKSLLMECLAGFHSEAQGTICVDRSNVSNFAPERRAIALMPQRWRLFPHWTVIRNLRFAARLGGADTERIRRLAQVVRVEGLFERRPGALSGGETQRVALMQTLLSPAKVLLLDEPLSAIDADLRSVVLELLQQESIEGRRICLISGHQAQPGHPMRGDLFLEKGRLYPATAQNANE